MFSVVLAQFFFRFARQEVRHRMAKRAKNKAHWEDPGPEEPRKKFEPKKTTLFERGGFKKIHPSIICVSKTNNMLLQCVIFQNF